MELQPPFTRLPEAVSLGATSPFEMRVHLGSAVSDTDVRSALKSGDMGFLHSFTTASAVDGPGLRVVAWTTACMFRCRYCHNPDTWTLSNGIPVTLRRAVEELRKYSDAMKAPRGGFTLSGGEPLMQDRFAVRLFAAAKEMGVHTAIETNGFYGHRLSDDELKLIDLVILDMKAFTPQQHRRVTSVEDNDEIFAFARRLAKLRRPMWLRYVLVPGLTDVTQEMEPLARFAASLGNVEQVEILPFHQMGRYKWSELELDYTLAAAAPPSEQSVARAVAIFRGAGLNAN